MRRYLLDTSVLSLLAPGRSGVAPAVVDWLHAHGEDLLISSITVAEIQQGICKLRRAGSPERADLLTDWLAELIETGAERITPFDAEAALEAGRISDAAIARGRHPGFADVAIAAIAIHHDLMLLTSNGKHFEPLGVRFADPSMPGFADA